MLGYTLCILQFTAAGFAITFFAAFTKIIKYIKPDFYEKQLQKYMAKAGLGKTQITYEDFEASFCTLSNYIFFFGVAYNLIVVKEAKQGHLTPNPLLVSGDCKIFNRLLDFMKVGRPLVVNFGSST